MPSGRVSTRSQRRDYGLGCWAAYAIWIWPRAPFADVAHCGSLPPSPRTRGRPESIQHPVQDLSPVLFLGTHWHSCHETIFSLDHDKHSLRGAPKRSVFGGLLTRSGRCLIVHGIPRGHTLRQCSSLWEIQRTTLLQKKSSRRNGPAKSGEEGRLPHCSARQPSIVT